MARFLKWIAYIYTIQNNMWVSMFIHFPGFKASIRNQSHYYFGGNHNLWKLGVDMGVGNYAMIKKK